MALTFVVATLAAACFVAAALGSLAPRRRALVAVVGIVLDWIPVAAGWMSVDAAPSPVTLAIHFGFGIVGYLLLGYCLLGWVSARERPHRVRLAFVGIWGIAYLAGVAMAIESLLR